MAPSATQVEIFEVADDFVPDPPKMEVIASSPEPAPLKEQVILYVATPCFGCLVGLGYTVSLLQLHNLCTKNNIVLIVDLLGSESLVQRARNILTKRFLESNATHLMWIDADITWNPEHVLRLIGFNKDVASASYPKKYLNWDRVKARLAAGEGEPLSQAALDFNQNQRQDVHRQEGSLLRVLHTATGFMLMKRATIEKLYEAYKDDLYCINDILGSQVKDYVAIFDCMIEEETRAYASEDHSVCRRIQKHGMEVWVDLAIPLVHTGSQILNGDIRQRIRRTINFDDLE